MPLSIGSRAIGTHALFFRDGDAYTVPGAGTAGRNAKPGASDPAWINVGIISESSDQRETTELEVHAPSPGLKRLYDVVEVLDKLTIKFTVDEVSPLAMEVLYRSLPLTAASTQFNPLEGKTKKGWLKLQRYDQNDVAVLIADLFVHLKVASEVNFGGSELAKIPFEAKVLHSIYNTCTL